MNVTPESTTKAELMEVPLPLIRLDPNNVRFCHISSELKDVQMEQLIWKFPATKRLYRQIKWSQGLQEKPILKGEGDHFIVKEGNMRIVCLRKLKQEIEFGDLDSDGFEIDPVRCIVLPKQVSEGEEALLLSRVHVKGKAQWGAFQKAAHIFDLTEKHGFGYADISEGIGVSQVKAKRMKRAFENMLKYERDHDDERWMEKYSYFYELEKKRYSKDKKNPLPKGWVEKNLGEFMEWIHTNQIEKGEEVRELPKIVGNEDAYQCLRDGGTVQEALQVLAQYDPTAGNKIFSRLARLREVINSFRKSEEDKIDAANNPARFNFLKELHKDIDNLISEVEKVKKSK
ncbi:hypothetical protein AKJ58_00620 [candidate division MSBL1 archaeon SCGC-AAA385D11]|uniref:ParB/Sulfiredoxin domain-containing protein n=1 Tax=candidate division MSBL1 archaeon SCGC-AAA385D11 TaxID=1698286 RepID=A0A133VP32_9EURY|nr:hypothetical protein AKJ58_00620 [candidate division MSBL1 archaeon SCGC-AAA385D11]